MVGTQELILQLAYLRGSFHTARGNYLSHHKNLDQEKDARVTIFSKCILVLESTLLCEIFHTFNLTDDKWWVNTHSEFTRLGPSSKSIKVPELNDRSTIIDKFDNFITAACFHLLFSSLES